MVSLSLAQPLRQRRIVAETLLKVAPMKQIVPIVLALIPLAAVVGACVTVP